MPKRLPEPAPLGDKTVFVRFVVDALDRKSGRRQGLFSAFALLKGQGDLEPHELEAWEDIRGWFEIHLASPESFSRSARPHAKKVALSWFKPSATEHIARMRAAAEILRARGVHVEALLSARPGYVVYEDEHQVVAEPFGDTGA